MFLQIPASWVSSTTYFIRGILFGKGEQAYKYPPPCIYAITGSELVFVTVFGAYMFTNKQFSEPAPPRSSSVTRNEFQDMRLWLSCDPTYD